MSPCGKDEPRQLPKQSCCPGENTCAAADAESILSDTDSSDKYCLDENCDEKCIEAAAAVECRVACDQASAETSACNDVGHPCSTVPKERYQHAHVSTHEHNHDKDDRHSWDACSTHLRVAFEKYTSFLEQALCICKKVQAEQFQLACRDRKAVEPSQRHRSHGVTRADTLSYATERLPHGKVTYRRTMPKRLGCSDKPAVHSHAQVAAKSCCSNDGTCTTEKSDIEATRPGHNHTLPSRHTLCQGKGPADIEKQLANVQSATFTVTGMDCSGCANIAARAFETISGVSNPSVAFIAGTASCDIDLGVTNVNEVIRLVERATKYKIHRLDLTHPSLDISMDAKTAQEVTRDLPKGVLGCKYVSNGQYQITYDASVVGARKVMELFPTASLAPPAQDESTTAGQTRLRHVSWLTLIAFCFTIPVVVFSWADPPISEHTVLYISIVLATVVQAIAIPEFYQPALSALIYNRVVEMDMLVVISITAAYGYSIVAFGLILAGRDGESTEPLFETSTLLISLILLGRLVAAYARKRAVEAVSLRSLQSSTAMMVDKSGSPSEIDARLLELGDLVLVGPHAQVVTDGTICSGSSDVDESMITGEAMPIAKFPGDSVVAGTMNGGGTLSVKVDRLPGKNTVTDIADLVQQAQASKPRVQDLADKVAGYFIPVVVTISIIVTVIWIVVGLRVREQSAGLAVGNAITYGIAVLAISCPCALGLAVPMVLVIAGGVSARLGVIIKTADVVERGFRCTDVIFDKTGTLTENTLDVLQEYVFERNALESTQIYALIRSMVKDNKHPVSQAIERVLDKRGVSPLELAAIESIPGAGVQCEYNGAVFRGGNQYWLDVNNDQVKALAAQGLAVYCVADASGLLAAFGLKTSLRKEAKEVVQNLQARRIAVHIVSGDGTEAVESVASDLGISLTNISSRQSPEGKQMYIRRLKQAGKVVLFCGDGTNDAVAVTEAAVGVQVESSSDVTRATADVVLLGDLLGVLDLLDISKAAFHRILFNFLWAALYNVFAILLASGAFVLFRIPPAYAGLGEIVSVVPVVLTAATLLTKNFGKAGRQ